MQLKSWIKSSLSRLGLDVRYAEKHDALRMQARLLEKVDVQVAIDGGAYHGEWASYYLQQFPRAQVFMFEPFPASQTILREKLGTNPRAHLIPAALGKQCERRTLYVNQLAATNSLFQPSTGAREKQPDPNWMKPAGTEEIEVTTLDRFCQEKSISRVNLLKLDVQGAELLALQGGEGLLSRGAIDVIYLEMQFTQQYEGQAWHFEIAKYLHDLKYELFGVYNLSVMQSGQMVQADGIFRRREAAG